MEITLRTSCVQPFSTDASSERAKEVSRGSDAIFWPMSVTAPLLSNAPKPNRFKSETLTRKAL